MEQLDKNNFGITRIRIFLDWFYVFLLTIIIYLTLPYGPAVSEWITVRIGYKSIGYIAAVIIVFILHDIVFYLIVIKKEKSFWSYLIFAVVAYIYGYLLVTMEIETEKIHFIEYGLLGLLIFNACLNHIDDFLIYFVVVSIGFLIGLADEYIQFLLPARTGELVDVLWNLYAVGLVMILVRFTFKPKRIKKNINRKSIRILVTLLSAVVILVPIFIHITSEFGYKYKFNRRNVVYSRFLLEDLKEYEKKNLKQIRQIFSTASYKPVDYDDFIKVKYTSREHPYEHELRVHLFRRDRYLAYYQHYKFMNDLADGKVKGTVKEIHDLPYEKCLYEYILAVLGKEKAEDINDTVIEMYLEQTRKKAEKIKNGERKRKTEYELKHYLFVSFRENEIIENYFSESIKTTPYKWSIQRNEEIKKMIRDTINDNYESAVSNRIITAFTITEMVITALVLLIILIIVYVKFRKD